MSQNIDQINIFKKVKANLKPKNIKIIIEIQLYFISHEKKLKNITNNKEKSQSTGTDSERTQMIN